MNIKPIIAGIGELLWDILPQGKQLGGAPCNFAYHAFLAGCEAFVISSLGQDDDGIEILARFDELKLGKKYIQQTSDFQTGKVTITLDARGIPNYNIHENVAWDNIQWNSSLEFLAKSIDAVCFGSLAQRNWVSQQTILNFLEATRPDCLVVFDINLRQSFFNREIIIRSLEYANILKLNDDELPIIADLLGLHGNEEKLLDQLMEKFDLKLIALTKGDKGSLLVTRKEKSFADAPKIAIADTVGAGDSFTAILVAGILQKSNLKRIHLTATQIAAFVCTQKGATPRVPESMLKF